VQAVGAVANVGLNFWLIPKYGVVGAATATLISGFISGYLVLLFHTRLYPMGKTISSSFCSPLRLEYRFLTDGKQWLNK
jgi:Na+-driven multidrug efflux pump